MGSLVTISTKAPLALLVSTVAPNFEKLRLAVRERSGIDFLAKCGDVFRDAGFVSSKDGVANRSNHKTGRAFDYDQTSPHILIEKEVIGNKMFFRTFIKCSKQDGSLGTRRKINDLRGYSYNGYSVDFTKIAEEFGFTRIPAWNGWQSHYNRREFWHYQDMTEDGHTLTWDEAMLWLKGKTRPTSEKVYGLNDRGEEVKKIQDVLVALGHLDPKQADGIFGTFTKAAVARLQFQNGLDADGLVGPKTRKLLFKE